MSAPTQLGERLLSAAATRLDHALELIESLASIESPTDDPTAVDRAIVRMTEIFEATGFRVRRIPGRAERAGSGRASAGQLLGVPTDRVKGRPVQLLVGHLDTVWPIGTIAEMPVQREEGRLHGPGTFDMKAGIIQAVVALEVLREVGVEPMVTPVFFLNTDEETGSDDSKDQVVRLGRIADRALVLEPPFGPEGLIKTARKGVLRYWITAHGQPAHAGLDPGKGASAIQAIAGVILKLHALTDLESGTTVNVGHVQGGTRPNVVGAQASIQVDVRATTAAAAEEIDRAIRSIDPGVPGVRLSVEGDMQCPPLERTPRNRELWSAAQRAMETLGLMIGEVAVGGGSDGNTLSLHTATLDGLGAVGDGAHAPHEHIVIDRIPERIALLAALMATPSLAGLAGDGTEP